MKELHQQLTDLQKENRVLDSNIGVLEKRIIILQSTIESWKRCSEIQDELLAATIYGHELDIKNNYTKNK